MTRATSVVFTPRNRMARILSGLDRKSFAEHVASAEKAVEAIATALADSIESDVRDLIHLCRQDEADIFSQCREIGWLALKIVESARLAGRLALAEAAKGVWEMIEALAERGVWHTDALRLHVDALGALATADANGPEGQAMARELKRMRETIGAGATP